VIYIRFKLPPKPIKIVYCKIRHITIMDKVIYMVIGISLNVNKEVKMLIWQDENEYSEF